VESISRSRSTTGSTPSTTTWPVPSATPPTRKRRFPGFQTERPALSATKSLKEKAPLVAIVESPEELQQALDRWAETERDAILEKTKRFPQLRIFAAGDMMYFIFFDAEHVMRDYVYVSVR